MPRFCLAIADAARARIFRVEPADPDRPELGVVLDERLDLIQPERRHPPSHALADRPGTAHAPTGLRFGLDDHRAARTDMIDRGFAAEIAEELARIVTDAGVTRAVVIASPRMLGALRGTLGSALPREVAVEDHALELTALSVPQLHDRLAELELVPPRSRAGRD